MLRLLATVALVVGACSPMLSSGSDASRPAPSATPPPSQSVSAPSSPPSARPQPSATASAPIDTPNPTEVTVFSGVLDVRPAGWTYLAGFAADKDFPNTFAQVYGPDGVAVPPYEGVHRITLYESRIPARAAYLESRVARSRRAGGRSVAVHVHGRAERVWINDATGELLLGWTVPGKTEVLVANAADFSIRRLVASAEGVSDCCG
jgi:hypothetical protein